MNRSLVLLLSLSVFISAQEEVAPDVTKERQRLLILPSESGENTESPEDKITAILASQAGSMKRYEVIDRTQLVTILNEQALQMSGTVHDSDIVRFGQIASAHEALVVKVTNFNQKGVPRTDKDDDDDEKGANFFDAVIAITKAVSEAKKDELYPNNIQTVVNFTITKLDIETGKVLDSQFIDVEYTGGNKAKSLSRSMKIVRRAIARKLRQMFLLTSEVLEVNGDEVLLFLGSNMGIKSGAVYEISSLGTYRTIRDREVIVPGKPIGIVEVKEVSPDASRARVLRRWGKIEPGQEALERMASLNGGGLVFNYGQNNKDFDIEFVGSLRVLRRFGGFFNIGVGNIEDSRHNIDFTFGGGGGFHANLIHTSLFRIGGIVSAEGKLIFRQDDENNRVTAGLFYPMLGVQTSVMINKKIDLVCSIDWVVSSAGGQAWQYTEQAGDESEESKTYPGKWNPAHPLGDPAVKAEGLYFSIGLRFFSF